MGSTADLVQLFDCMQTREKQFVGHACKHKPYGMSRRSFSHAGDYLESVGASRCRSRC